MRQKASTTLQIVGIVAWLVAAPADSVRAEIVGLGPRSAAIEMGVEIARQRISAADASERRTDSYRIEEELALKQDGIYLYDPEIITASLGGTFGLSQEWRSTETDSVLRHGDLTGYNVFTQLFPERATSLTLSANRNESTLSRELAGRSEVLTENHGATLSARRFPIPSTFTFRQELQEEESRTGGVVARREDRRNIIRYEGQRGWTDSEMDLLYEFIDLSAEVLPSLNYESHEASMRYSLDFGSELNRHWNSWVRYLDRSGVSDLTTTTVDEMLRIDHNERLRSEYQYFLARTDIPQGATTTHTGSLSAHHRLFDSLNTSLRADTIIQTLPGGDKDTYSTRLDFAYTKSLPGSGRLNLDLGGLLEYEDDDFNIAEGFVAQELHTFATPFALPVSLDNPFVIVTSIVITKETFGPLPAGCIAPSGPPTSLVEGRDFTLRTVGDITEIVPVPCSGATPGVNSGDVIAVDYRFSASQSMTFGTATWRTNVSLDYRWVRPYFYHEQTGQSLISGVGEQLLDDRQSDTLGVEFRYDGQRFWSSFVAEAQHLLSRQADYDMARTNQIFGWRILPELTFTLNGDQALSNFSKPARRSRSYRGRVSLNYANRGGLFADLFTELRWLEDTLVASERIAQAGLRVQWTFRMIEIRSTLEFLDRMRGDTDTQELRAALRVIRHF